MLDVVFSCSCILVLFIPVQVSCGGSVQLTYYGPNENIGLVEVKPDGSSQWGYICSNEFDIIDADVICRQLNYGWAVRVYEESDPPGNPILWNVDCEYGDEENIFDCENNEGTCNNQGVIVECEDVEYSEPFKKIRLDSADNVNDENLAIRDNGQWKPICANGWDIEDTTVACRQLGFLYAVNFTTYTNPAFYANQIYTNFDCEGNEGYLLACEHMKEICIEYVAIKCAVEFEDYAFEDYPWVSSYYPWFDPCDEFHCENGGTCYIDEYYQAVCECTQNWQGEHCGDIPGNDGGGGGGNSNENPPPTDAAPQQGSEDSIIIYVAIGAAVFVVIIILIVVASIARRKTERRSQARVPVEIGLKGKPVTEKKLNNNTYQQPNGPKKPPVQPQALPHNNPAAPASDYYLQPSPNYTARDSTDDYTALTSPSSEIYEEIPYDSIDNGGYMDLKQPSEYEAPPALPKPR
ncbi:uncharacterized protein [Antedon mediterranea]|uniref:uncharacterized protein n=1 Tax=Antedon mediterranea TaxID=105859 RepID=UPI003AF9B058